MKRLLTATAIVALVLGAGFYAIAQQPYQLTPLDESKRDRSVAVGGGKFHVLPATLETTQWGWLATTTSTGRSGRQSSSPAS